MSVSEFAAELIRRPSPSGQEQKVAQAISERMHYLGFDRVWIDQNGSVLGEIIGGKPGPTVLFDGHIDTVPVDNPSSWTVDPYGGEILDGKLYGRGATDMKGSVAAMVYGAAELIHSKSQWGGRVIIAGVVMEEIFEGVSLGNIIDEVHPDYVIIGEASELRLNIGQRGRAEIALETSGISCHSANPDKGDNAVYHMAPLVSALQRMTHPKHPQLGDGITVLTDIISQPYPGASVVPNRCRATLDRRLLVGETQESVLERLRTALGDDTPFTLQIVNGELKTYTGRKVMARRFFPAWLFDQDAEFVQKAFQALEKIHGTPDIGIYSFCTDGSCSAGERKIPTLGYGPSKESLAHVVDEWVSVDELEKAVQGYAAIARSLLR